MPPTARSSAKTSRTSSSPGRSACRCAVPSAAAYGRCAVSSRKGRIARVLFCIDEGRMVLLHAFIKKTQKTPNADRDLALKRMKEVT